MSTRCSEAQIEHKECAVCTEQITEHSPRKIGEDHVCISCVKRSIVPLFDAALAAEFEYPPKYGSILLNISDFADVLDEAFVLRYRRLEVEYSTPVNDRIYCTHQIHAAWAPRRGELAQGKLALELDDAERAKHAGLQVIICGGCLSVEHHALQGEINMLECWRCRGVVCGRCRLPLLNPTASHECIVSHSVIVDLESEGQKRGVDFQTCPTCFRSIGLLDGCNAVTCVASCMTEFCFCCGAEADEGSSHWTVGESGCPRYGTLDKNPIFDDPDSTDIIIGEPSDTDGDVEELRFAREVEVTFDAAVQWMLDRIAAFGRADVDLLSRLRERRTERRREHHGDPHPDPVRERVVALWEAIDDPWADHEEFLAVLQEMGAPWIDETLITGAVLANFNDRWRSYDDVDIRLRGTPSLLLANIRVLQTRRELRFDLSGEPLNESATEFISRHEAATSILGEVGFDRLEDEFPLMLEYWYSYVDQLEEALRDVLMPQFALFEEVKDFRRDPEVTDIRIEKRLYPEHGWEALLGHEAELLPDRLNKQISLLDNDDGDDEEDDPLKFSPDWMPLNKATVEFLIEHIEIIGIIDQIPLRLVDRLPLLKDHWTAYFDSLPPGLDESVMAQLPQAPRCFTWLLVQ